MIVVTDADDPRVAAFRLGERALTPRTARRAGVGGWFVAEGDLVVERALDAGCRPVALLTDDRRPAAVVERVAGAAEVFAAGEDLRRTITGLGVGLDVIGLFERPTPRPAGSIVTSAQRLILVEAVDNPTNVGAIVRSAVAMGADGMLLDRTCADPLARRALRVAMGTALALPHARVDDAVTALGLLHDAGAHTIALTPGADAEPIEAVAARLRGGPVAVLLGAERSGLTPDAARLARSRARIPMATGVDSLNVAAAAAVACYVLFGPHRPD